MGESVGGPLREGAGAPLEPAMARMSALPGRMAANATRGGRIVTGAARKGVSALLRRPALPALALKGADGSACELR
ncbi:MAG TPA: hypothetical protein H9823_05210 [Candidatus Rubneribacter avistercoris]|nr:hypothetical protein [Candidatus Rubneribacter avistercoris]